MKKLLLGLTSLLLCGFALTGCTDQPTDNSGNQGDNDNTGNTGGNDNTGGNNNDNTFDVNAAIQVYSRDTTSGTRDGFFTNIGYENAIKDDTKLAEGTVITDSNGSMITYVAQDEYAIGYASLASVVENADSVKGLTYDGVEATEENVVNGTYKLARNFNYMTRQASDMTANERIMVNAFLAYMDSFEGMSIIASNDGILMDDITIAPKWSDLVNTNEDVKAALALSDQGTKVTINLGGSTSVEKIAEALTKAFKELVSGFNPNHNHTGSGDAYKRTQGSEKDGENKLHIGFLSREIKLTSDEPAAEGTYGFICKDGIVAIVNPANVMINDANADLLVKIFKGEITTWAEL